MYCNEVLVNVKYYDVTRIVYSYHTYLISRTVLFVFSTGAKTNIL
jgi:hypothetical protein